MKGKKLKAICLIHCFLISIFSSNFTANAHISDESYAENTVFEISNKESFLELSKVYDNADTVLSFEKRIIKLTQDIDLEGSEITPIGSGNCAFEGTFDGQGHTIKNFKVTNESLNYSALFGLTYFATIKNLNLDNVTIVGRASIGSLVGESLFTTVQNCNAQNVDISCCDQEWNLYAGGLIGVNSTNTVGAYSEEYDYSKPHSLVENCKATGKISLDNKPQIICAGGLIGLNRSISDISKAPVPCMSKVIDCVANVKIDGAEEVDSDSRIKLTAIGGFVGLNHDTNGTKDSGSIIDHCRAEGEVSGGTTRYNLYVGGFAGASSEYQGYSVIRNCCSTGEVTGGEVVDVNKTLGNAYTGGFVGSINTAKVVPDGLEEGMSQESGNIVRDSYIENCYTTSMVYSGLANVIYTGGFAGADEALNGTTYINNCYSANTVKYLEDFKDYEEYQNSENYIGAFIGSINTETESSVECETVINNCYYNKDLVNIEKALGASYSESHSMAIKGLSESEFTSEKGLLKSLNDWVNAQESKSLYRQWVLDSSVSKYPSFGDLIGTTKAEGTEDIVNKAEGAKDIVNAVKKLMTGEGFPVAVVVFLVITATSSVFVFVLRRKLKITNKKEG